MENIEETQVVNEVVPTQPDANSQEQTVVENPTTAKTFTSEQVKSIVDGRLKQAYKSFHELMNAPEDVRSNKNLFAKWIKDQLNNASQDKASLDALRGEHETLKGENFNLKKELAFYRNNVDLNRESDIMALFKGLDLPFTEEKLVELIATHPEWVNAPKQAATFEQIGKPQNEKPATNEKAEILKLLGAN